MVLLGRFYWGQLAPFRTILFDLGEAVSHLVVPEPAGSWRHWLMTHIGMRLVYVPLSCPVVGVTGGRDGCSACHWRTATPWYSLEPTAITTIGR